MNERQREGGGRMLTCMVSMSSELSHTILESLTFLISSSCSTVKELGHPPFSYQKRSPNLSWANRETRENQRVSR